MFKVFLVIMGLIFSPTLAKYFEECLDVAADSLIPVAHDCRAYIFCSAEQNNSFKDSCPEDSYFASETGECLMDYENICPKEANHTTEVLATTIGISTTTPATIITEVSTTTPLTHTTLSQDLTTIYEHVVVVDAPTKRPKCSPQANAYYPHSERCEYYYKCVHGYLTILRCNFYYAWDYHKEMCVPHNMVQCYDTAKLN